MRADGGHGGPRPAQLRQAEAARAQRQAESTQAQANLERDTAQLENARVQEQRYRRWSSKELVAREQYDQSAPTLTALEATVSADRAAVENASAAARAAEAMVENARAVIRADEAMVETARLQLAYTTIRAPMDGRTGNLLVQAGNVVKSNEDNPLVVIAQVRPDLRLVRGPRAAPRPRLKQLPGGGPAQDRGAAADGGAETRGRRRHVREQHGRHRPPGRSSSRPRSPTPNNALWPGQFVDVALTLTTEPAVVVPSQAVQAGQQGPFVFVVKPDLTVESRPVKVGRRLATRDRDRPRAWPPASAS